MPGLPRIAKNLIILTGFALFWLGMHCHAFAVPVAVIECNPCSGQEGDILQFDATGSYDPEGGNVSYEWEFEDTGETSGLARPEHTFASPHPYGSDGWTVTLTVRDGDWVTDSTSMVIPVENIKPTPVVYGYNIAGEKEYDEVAVFVDTLATLGSDESYDGQSASSAGSQLRERAWDFDWNGDPNAFNVDNRNSVVQHRFSSVPAIGYVNVGVRVTDYDDYPTTGEDPPPSVAYKTLKVFVLPEGPWARIRTPENAFYEGEEVFFYDNSMRSDSNIIKWEWDFDYDDDPDNFNADVTIQDPAYDSPDPNPTPVPYTFADSKQYLIALRVTDNEGRTNIGRATVNPENVPPQADLKVYACEYDGCNPELGLSEPCELLSEPYQVKEGVSLRFDASGSVTDSGYETDGEITGYQWDWTYDEIYFSPLPSDRFAVMDNAWDEDTAHNIPQGNYKVMLRVFDDDHNGQTSPSYDDLIIEVEVEDIRPLAMIEGPVELGEGVEANFGVIDYCDDIRGRNADEITRIEWDTEFPAGGTEFDFVARVTGTGEDAPHTISLSWDTPSEEPRVIAVRIFDDDGFSSFATHEVTVIDQPPGSLISVEDYAVETIDGQKRITVDEGEAITFHACNSFIPPSTELTGVFWDLQMGEECFQADGEYSSGTTSQCEGMGVCSDFTCAWASCTLSADCPTGMSHVTTTTHTNDGPSESTIALCMEDTGNPGLCSQTPAPCPQENDWIDTVKVNVRNVDPWMPPICTTGDCQGVPHDRPRHPDETPEKVEFRYNVPFQDAPGDLYSLSFECPTIPDGMEALTGAGSLWLEWTPTSEQPNCRGIDPYEVCCRALDDDGGESELECWTMIVTNVNDRPRIDQFMLNPNSDIITVGQEFTIACVNNDPDKPCGDSERFWMENKPDGMVKEAGCRFTWTPTEAQLGTHHFTLWVEDNVGGVEGSDSVKIELASGEGITVVRGDDVVTCDPVEAQEPEPFDPGLVCLDGTVADNPRDREITGFDWTITDGAEQVCIDEDLVNADQVSPSFCFVATAHGEYEAGLACNTDNADGPTGSNAIAINNIPPTAIAGGSRNYRPGALVYLNGTRSGDYNINDDNPALDIRPEFFWSEPAGVSLLDDLAAEQPSFVYPDYIGKVTFGLILDDGELLSDESFVTIEFLDTSDMTDIQAAPYAHIEVSGDPIYYEQIILDASMSKNRRNNMPLTYEWRAWLGDDEENTIELASHEDGEMKKILIPENNETYHVGLIVKAMGLESRETFVEVVATSFDKELPTANAGANNAVKIMEHCQPPSTKYAKFELNATGSQANDPLYPDLGLKYHWRQTGGVKVALKDAETAQPSFIATRAGLYTFELIVEEDRDNGLKSEPDEVTLLAFMGDGFPVASVAGLDENNRLILNPGESATLDATGSFDADSYEWVQLAGPSVVLSNWFDPVVTFTPDVNDVDYVFRLIVFKEMEVNGQILQVPSYPLDVKVRRNTRANTPPECSLEIDDEIEVGQCEIVELAASAYDPDEGDSVTHLWECTKDDEPVALETDNQAIGLLSTEEAGLYLCDYTATDSAFETCSLSVGVSVVENNNPSADTGVEGNVMQVQVGANVQLDATNSRDPEGHELTYHWEPVESEQYVWLTKEDLDPHYTDPRPSFVAYKAGTFRLSLTVFDDCNGQSDPVFLDVVASEGGDDITCIDADGDGYFTQSSDPSCGPTDCNDMEYGLTTDCDTDGDADDDTGGGGGGGGCQTGGASHFGFILAFFVLGLMVVRRRRVS